MAQAARLSLRMQKELKILLSDPPLGSTLPHLSPDSQPSSSSSNNSMSTIHAQIQGPEGTVYAKGVFGIQIQIPERYPFQPPGVTFVTPIYHPNIDNGGRICLDILNLPPKGAWQPSLNIWTVITSIRLLLSEPNPDDGLMCEVSKEYKYNRQAFDQKAISMTEKFAKAGAGGSCQSIDTNPSPSMMEVKKAAESKLCGVDEHTIDQKKFSGNRRKLSLEYSVSSPKRSNELDVNKVHAPPMEAEGIVAQGSKGTPLDYNSSHDNPNGTRRRLSLESFSQQQKIDCINPYKAVQNYCLLQATSCHEKRLDQDGESVRGEKSTSSEQLCRVTEKQPSESTEAPRVSNFEESKSLLSVPQAVASHSGFIDRTENVSANINCKKPCLAGKKLSLRAKGSSKKTTKEDKENMVPARKLPLFSIQSPPSKPSVDRKPSADNMIHEKLQCNQGEDGNIKQQVTEESAPPEAVIVLDSEDSEEETNTAPARTKLPLARRLGKWRVKA